MRQTLIVNLYPRSATKFHAYSTLSHASLHVHQIVDINIEKLTLRCRSLLVSYNMTWRHKLFSVNLTTSTLKLCIKRHMLRQQRISSGAAVSVILALWHK